MISPADVWEALDALALEQGLTPSGLARAAGLDPTTFNPSRRISPQADGRADMRWMALPTLLRALDVLKISPVQFIQGLDGAGRGAGQASVRRLRGLPLSRLQGGGLFNSAGYPTGVQWEDVTLPCAISGDAYAVRVDTDALEPLLREGSSLVVMPDMPPRRSDRVLLLQPGMQPVVGILVDNTARHRGVAPALPISASASRPQNTGDVSGGTAEGLRWAVLPYKNSQAAGEDVQGNVCGIEETVVPVQEGKSGVWVHRIVMATF
ncbi:helix-turn-helix transcriptional regulator [Acetobacter persici]|uniref:helix-turn-helix transcriptional regulator n=1 Tax=Acetobacter persici TaxID=1076596 RepID=UPI001BA70836|nr:helix-turn-helix transcriptional regulator [Acetobacter persici]MBS1000648.1 helix-turn-helix transcriptional regulator [Acetobacter persici]